MDKMTEGKSFIPQMKAPDMADLLEYFEARSRTLDEEGQPVLDPSTLQFVSLIKFNGISILPPVLTPIRREEMISYKHEAIRREKCSRAKKREELHDKVQSIVAGLEERRAAKHASESQKHSKTPSPSSRTSSHKQPSQEVISKVTTKVTSKPGVKPPSEIIVNVTDSDKGTNSPKNTSRAGKSPSTTSKQPVSPSRSALHGGGDGRKKEHTNYKSLGKLGVLSKQKSHSSQNLERAGTQGLQYDSDASTSSSKNLSLSPNSRALLPHPPVGRPPSRGSHMRQSASTPDLRQIDVTVKTEDLRKPLPSSRSLSPKGGRPQSKTIDKMTNEKSSGAKTKDTKQLNKPKPESSSKPKENIQKPEISIKAKESVSEQKSRKIETENKKPKEDTVKKEITQKSKPKEQQALLNPLEALEQELSKEKENEMMEKFKRSQIQQPGAGVRQELDPIQTATAELFPFPISEEQALATLDSLQSDFASLEQADSLPKDYNGIPLTSLKQQQIIHMLTKLSRALNMEDTLTSTVTSDVNVEPRRIDNVRGQSSRLEGGGDLRSVQTGASARREGHSEMGHVGDESSVNMTSVPDNSSFQSSSTAGAHSRARMSPTGSSILSSASSVSASRSRMSPKSLKNTVHFSSLVTEISTSASQSYEDKISFRKLDITPKSSENFEEDHVDGNSDSKNFHSHSAGAGPGPSLAVPDGNSNLLSRVALSPSVDLSQGSPGEFHGQHPFENSSPENELNTSDKENEFIPAEPESSDENYSSEINVRSGRNQPVLNVFTAHISPGPIGENHPAVLKASLKSDGFPVKEIQDKVLQENPQYFYGTNSTDLDRYLQRKVTPSDSISSMQEEITRSYLMSQSKPERDIYQLEEQFVFKKPKNPLMKTVPLLDDMDDSSIFLQPVIFTNTGGSLKENRSMLDEEEIIRSNLQRVQLEDSNSEHSSSEDEAEDKIHKFEKRHSDNNEFALGQPIVGQIEYEEEELVHDEPMKMTVREMFDQLEQSVKDEHNKGDTEENEDDSAQNVSGKDHSECTDVSGKDHSEGTDVSGKDHSECTDVSGKDHSEGTDVSGKDHSEGTDVSGKDHSEGTDGEHVELAQCEHELGDTHEAYEEESGEVIRDQNLEDDSIIIREVNEQTENDQNKSVVPKRIKEVNEEPVHKHYTDNEPVRIKEINDQPARDCFTNDKPVRIKDIIDQPVRDGTSNDKVRIKEVPEILPEVEHEDDQPVRTKDMEQEEEAKAEHIQRYLNQVHEHSLHHEEDDTPDDLHVSKAQAYSDVMGDIGAMIQSFTASMQSMNHLSQEELFQLQTEQFELIQQKLLEHQRAQLEELFVTQRKEQMNLEREIEEYQAKIKDVDQAPILEPVNTVPMSEFLKPQMSSSLPQVTQAWQPHPQQPIHSSAKSPPFRIQPVASAGLYQNTNMSFNTSYSTIAPYPDPRMCMMPNIDPRSGVGLAYPLGYMADPNVSSISHNTSFSTIPNRDPGMTRGNLAKPQKMDVILSQDPGSSQTSNPFIYPSSPSLYMNPKDRDNASVSDVSGFAKATPKQLTFSNQSTPVQPPRVVNQSIPLQPRVQNQTVPAQSKQVTNQPVKVNTAATRDTSSHSQHVFTAPNPRDNSSHTQHAAPTRDMSSYSHHAAQTRDMSLHAQHAAPTRDMSSHAQHAAPTRDMSSHSQHAPPTRDMSSHPQHSKHYKPLMHSPVKQTSAQRQNSGRYLIPPEVFDPAMQDKFCRVSAAVKGYLTRRLLKTPKVQAIIKTIEDTRNFAFSFQAETPIKKGTYSREDWTLLERLVNQLQAGLLDIHEIFFVFPVSERMNIISAARQLEHEKLLRETHRSSMDEVSRSQPKLSKATLKALERKKKAQLAEEAVFGSMEFRPKSAPPATSSPHSTTDISGPLQRHYHSLFVRALRPLQGQISPITADHHITVKEVKERPKTAPEKRKSTESGNKVKKSSSDTKSSKSSGGKSSRSSASGNNNNKQKTSTTSSKTKKSDKAWR